MKRTKFLVSKALLAAGFAGHQDALAQGLMRAVVTGNDDPHYGGLLKRFSQDHSFTLASHSSHSSHASHSSGYGSGGHYSHTSHRSSAGGGYEPDYDGPPTYSPPYVAPAPTPTPTPTPELRVPPQPLFAPDVRADPPPADGLPVLSGRTKRSASIVRRVQLALLAQDLYAGPISGTVAPNLRSALRKFQKARGLDVTGTITPATLDALMVSNE